MYHSCLAGLGRRFQVRGLGRMRLATALSLPRPLVARDRSLTPTRLDLLDLTEFQLDRRGATEDRHRDLHARACLVDFLDDTRERGERAIGHAYVLADLERHRRLR